MHASFLGHRIEKESTGYTAVLYLDPRLTEFAGESGEYEKEKNLREAAFQYLHEKFPELTIKSVKIMLGSLLLTSFSLAAPVQHAQAYHAAPGQTAHPQWVVHYRVQAGDSLWLIARRYETTINEIKRLNRLHTDWIYPGQVLHVPRNDEIMDLVKQLPDGIYTVGNRGGHVRFIQRAFHYLGYPLAARRHFRYRDPFHRSHLSKTACGTGKRRHFRPANQKSAEPRAAERHDRSRSGVYVGIGEQKPSSPVRLCSRKPGCSECPVFVRRISSEKIDAKRRGGGFDGAFSSGRTRKLGPLRRIRIPFL